MTVGDILVLSGSKVIHYYLGIVQSLSAKIRHNRAFLNTNMKSGKNTQFEVLKMMSMRNKLQNSLKAIYRLAKR